VERLNHGAFSGATAILVALAHGHRRRLPGEDGQVFTGIGRRGTYFDEERFRETVMHWRKAPSKANGKVFYIVVSVLFASVALTTTLLALHFHT
jgi:hypothetical protein